MAPSAINISSTQNGHDEPDKHRRLLLVSVPRTASNLLLKVLNVPNQPNVLTNDKCGYFFYKAYMAANVDSNMHSRQWGDAERAQIRDIYQDCLNGLEEYSARARADNKLMFAKEHSFWLVNPATNRAQSAQSTGNGDCAGHADANHETLKSSFNLTFPSTYGPTQTFSPHNPTVFSDEYIRTWQLAFIIRHPALAWPSMYRAMLKMHAIGVIDEDGVKGSSVDNMSFRWTRMLFDWCVEQQKQQQQQSNGQGPLIIDAHDVIHNPAVVLRFCEGIGLDPNAVQFEWSADDHPKQTFPSESESESKKKDEAQAQAVSAKEMEQKRAQIMLGTLQSSRGVVKDKAPATVDIAAEAEKWRAEFGEEAAGMVEKAVWDAMPDYEYLKERRVRA